MTRVRACIVAWRSGERAVRACRSALREGAEVVLVDNGPEGETADLVERELAEVTVLRPPRNLGFAAGAHLAARGAAAEHLLFLNPDAELEEGALAALLAHLDADPGTGVVGPALEFPDGRPQPSVRPDPSVRSVLHQYSAWKFLFLFRGEYRRSRARRPEGREPVEAEVLMGSALLVRRSLYEALGGFDPRYFMYYEEADLCRRAREAGARVVFVPAARAVHAGGASEALAPAGLAAVRIVSAQRYLRRFAPPLRYALFRLAFVPAVPLRAMWDLCRDLFYVGLYSLLPGKRDRVRRKAREALAAARLLTADLFRVAAG